MEPMVETRHLLWMTGLLEARLKGIVPETKAKMETKIENTILTEMDILKVLDQIVMKGNKMESITSDVISSRSLLVAEGAST